MHQLAGECPRSRRHMVIWHNGPKTLDNVVFGPENRQIRVLRASGVGLQQAHPRRLLLMHDISNFAERVSQPTARTRKPTLNLKPSLAQRRTLHFFSLSQSESAEAASLCGRQMASLSHASFQQYSILGPGFMAMKRGKCSLTAS